MLLRRVARQEPVEMVGELPQAQPFRVRQMSTRSGCRRDGDDAARDQRRRNDRPGLRFDPVHDGLVLLVGARCAPSPVVTQSWRTTVKSEAWILSVPL